MNGATAQAVADSPAGPLMVRAVSAALLVLPVLAVIHFGRPYFDILVGLGAVVLAWELNRVSAGAPGKWTWRTGGLAYIGVACWGLIYLRQSIDGRGLVLWLFIVVWAADTGAYAFGRLIGGPKLAPVISPKKTWAGLIGGIACAALAGAAASVQFSLDVWEVSAFGAFLGAVAQGGDLLESWAKRCFGVKDSGSIIPGHGGLFDRVDGLMAAAIGFVVFDFFFLS